MNPRERDAIAAAIARAEGDGLRVVHARVDAWVFAFRVAIHEGLAAHLAERAEVRREHGQASIEWGPLVGALAFSRDDRWLVVNTRYRVQVLSRAPGGRRGDEHGRGAEPGWTVEVIWYAQGAADMAPRDVYAETRALAEGLGRVFASRLRRIDLAADVAGFVIREDDPHHMVRRARAKLGLHAFEEAEDANDPEETERRRRELADEHARRGGAPDDGRVVSHYYRTITGISVCPGGAIMARVYNKREHLSLLGVDTREAEEARWKEGGWNGEDAIARVEFQLRGEVLEELGIRDPEDVHDPATGERFAGIEAVLDRVWRACLAWASMRVDNGNERRTRWALDPRWAVLYTARFGGAAGVHRRVRRRGGASPEQTLGCALSTAARVGLLVALAERITCDEHEAQRRLEAEIGAVFETAGALVAAHLVKRWGGPVKALEHVGIVTNATRRRFADPLERSAPAEPSIAAVA